MVYVLVIFWIFLVIGIFSVTELDIEDIRSYIWYWVSIIGMVISLLSAIMLLV